MNLEIALDLIVYKASYYLIMEKFTFSLLTIILFNFTSAQNVGIGTISPLARLHVADSSVLFSGPSVVSPTTSFLPPAQGAGTRLMWYPEKGAFRVGTIGNNEWDMNSIGINSIATGNGTIASGNFSTAMGSGSVATGDYSTALGQSTSAAGLSATAIGAGAKAFGPISTSIGYATSAKSLGEVSLGLYNTEYTPISPNGWNGKDRLLSIGNGYFSTGNSDAMVILKNGAIGIGTSNPAPSAILELIDSTRGFLPPRLTSMQRDAITSPENGLMIFNTTSNGIEIKTTYGWISLTASSADALPTIQIGTQKWASKNLDVAYYRNGDPIPQVTDPTAWAALTTGAWCYYNNDSTMGTKYGKLYNWYAINDPRGLAPEGWHIPSDVEWTALETTLGGASVAGGKMKEAGTLSWTGPNIGGNNNSGFAGLPGGTRSSDGTFFNISNVGLWWSSTESDTTYAFLRFLLYGFENTSRNPGNKKSGYSARCVRD